MWCICPATQLNLEFVGPGHQWAPEKEIEQDDERDERGKSKQYGPGIACVGSSLQVGTKPRQLERTAPIVSCSDAIRKNHPPAQLIILFQIRPIIEDGSSRTRKRRHG